jgi:phospholipid transport system substrate-binding protein
MHWLDAVTTSKIERNDNGIWSLEMKSLMSLKRFFLFGLAALTVGQFAHAQSVAPDEFVKKLTEDVMAAVKSDREIQAGNIRKINSLVESKILPYVNFQKMTASAVGRFWSQATPEQQKQIIEQFRLLLTYTYSGALSDVRDQKIEFRPFRGDLNDPFVEVRSQVINPKGGDPVQLNYRLEKSPDGWRIIDVNVLGVWLVETYRGSFASEINKNGIDGLVKTLTEKNKALAAQKGRAT